MSTNCIHYLITISHGNEITLREKSYEFALHMRRCYYRYYITAHIVTKYVRI